MEDIARWIDHWVVEFWDGFARLAAAADSVEKLGNVFDGYPEFQPPAGAVAR